MKGGNQPEPAFRIWAIGVLALIGFAQMTGDLLHLPALKGIAAATGASPAPKVFSAVKGLETFSTQYFIEWIDKTGASHSVEITPERYAHMRGPYNRRNVYGAVLAYGPVLVSDPRTRPMFDAVSSYALCGEAPLLRELGIPIEAGRVSLRIRLQTPAGVPPPELPLILRSSCPEKRMDGRAVQYLSYRTGTLSSAALLDTASMGHGGIFQSRCLASCGGEPAHSSIPQCACGLGPAGIPSFSAHFGRTLVCLPHYGILGQARCTRALVFVGLLGRNPLISNPALPFVGWLLLLHAVLPKAPYGSWEARRRDDPRGKRAARHPDVVFQIKAAGHEVGNHYFKNCPTLGLCLARIKSAFEMNNIQRGHVTCYMEDISLLRSFGEGHPIVFKQNEEMSSVAANGRCEMM